MAAAYVEVQEKYRPQHGSPCHRSRYCGARKAAVAPIVGFGLAVVAHVSAGPGVRRRCLSQMSGHKTVQQGVPRGHRTKTWRGTPCPLTWRRMGICRVRICNSARLMASSHCPSYPSTTAATNYANATAAAERRSALRIVVATRETDTIGAKQFANAPLFSPFHHPPGPSHDQPRCALSCIRNDVRTDDRFGLRVSGATATSSDGGRGNHLMLLVQPHVPPCRLSSLPHPLCTPFSPRHPRAHMTQPLRR